MATNRGDRWFFVFGFEKNERDNIAARELQALQAIATFGAYIYPRSEATEKRSMYAELLKDVVDFHDDLVRNIKGIRASQNLFDDLSDDPAGQALAAAAESAHRIPSEAPLITRPGSVLPYLSHESHAGPRARRAYARTKVA